MTELTEERLAELIAVLAPAPTAWVQAAIELPRARTAIDGLIERATADRQARRAILADLEQALRDEGVEPGRELLRHLKVRLSRLEE
jgi:hypothetical protein